MITVEISRDGVPVRSSETIPREATEFLNPPLTLERGRKYGIQELANSLAGRATISLFNDAGEWLDVRVEDRVTVKKDGEYLWVGRVDHANDVIKHQTGDSRRDLLLRCLGYLSVLARDRRQIDISPQFNITCAAAAKLIFDAVDFPADMRGEFPDYTMNSFWVTGLTALEAMRRLQWTVGGFLKEDRDGRVGIETQQARQTPWTQVIALDTTDASANPIVFTPATGVHLDVLHPSLVHGGVSAKLKSIKLYTTASPAKVAIALDRTGAALSAHLLSTGKLVLTDAANRSVEIPLAERDGFSQATLNAVSAWELGLTSNTGFSARLTADAPTLPTPHHFQQGRIAHREYVGLESQRRWIAAGAEDVVISASAGQQAGGETVFPLWIDSGTTKTITFPAPGLGLQSVKATVADDDDDKTGPLNFAVSLAGGTVTVVITDPGGGNTRLDALRLRGTPWQISEGALVQRTQSATPLPEWQYELYPGHFINTDAQLGAQLDRLIARGKFGEPVSNIHVIVNDNPALLSAFDLSTTFEANVGTMGVYQVEAVKHRFGSGHPSDTMWQMELTCTNAIEGAGAFILDTSVLDGTDTIR